jgi:hypothetical protein
MNDETIFWKDKFEGECTGGIFYRAFDLRKFIETVEKNEGEVVGIKFEGNNLELIVSKKDW